MAREEINLTFTGNGLEGLLDYTNTTMDNFFVPLFLFVFYGLSIFLLSKTEWKLGGCILFTSVVFFILGMIMQTITEFNQMVMFIFALGTLVGVVMSFIENSK